MQVPRISIYPSCFLNIDSRRERYKQVNCSLFHLFYINARKRSHLDTKTFKFVPQIRSTKSDFNHCDPVSFSEASCNVCLLEVFVVNVGSEMVWKTSHLIEVNTTLTWSKCSKVLRKLSAFVIYKKQWSVISLINFTKWYFHLIWSGM